MLYTNRSTSIDELTNGEKTIHENSNFYFLYSSSLVSLGVHADGQDMRSCRVVGVVFSFPGFLLESGRGLRQDYQETRECRKKEASPVRQQTHTAQHSTPQQTGEVQVWEWLEVHTK